MFLMDEESALELSKYTKDYMWKHNPHLHKDKKFQKLCGKTI